jgi:hypothetical protein
MTERSTTTSDQTLQDRDTRDQPAPPDTSSQAPTGTRELRDAQSGRRSASARAGSGTPAISPAQPRPAIRAEGSQRAAAETRPGTSGNTALFDEAAGHALRERWLVIQTEFVDEPRVAVQKADSLVAEVLQRLTDTFARERESLEAGWSRRDGSTDEITTEDLRQAIQRYRSFFNRLLSL